MALLLFYLSYVPKGQDRIQTQMEAAKSENMIEEVVNDFSVTYLDLMNLAPRKPDWDLKRDVAKKLEKLEKRTQTAIAELIYNEIATMEEKAEHDIFTLKEPGFGNKCGPANYDRNAVTFGGPFSAFSGIPRTTDIGVKYFRDSLCSSINPNPFLKLPPSSPLMTSGIFGSPRTDFVPELPIAPAFAQIFQRRRRRESRPRRQRTTFTSEQTLKLELEYNRADYITRPRRFELAEMLNLSESQIKIWFQNRRAKDKRIEKAHVDQQLRTMGYPPLTGTIPLPVSYTSMRSQHSLPSLPFPVSQMFFDPPPSPSVKMI